MRTTSKTFDELSRAINDLKSFQLVQFTPTTTADDAEIDAAIEAALAPFYAKREKAIYEAAKQFVAEYEEARHD